MAKPPSTRGADNPWPQWPRIFRVDYGHAEAAHVYGSDPRRYGVMTKRFVGGPDGRLRGVEIVDVRFVHGAEGRGGGCGWVRGGPSEGGSEGRRRPACQVCMWGWYVCPSPAWMGHNAQRVCCSGIISFLRP
jgi:hypothetical protein